MIQLKSGIPPVSLGRSPKPTHRRKMKPEKKNAGLRFDRVFSDTAVAPFDQSNGNDARRKSTTTAAKSFSSRKISKFQKTGAPSRQRSRSQNISTATSPTALIRTKAEEKLQCGN